MICFCHSSAQNVRKVPLSDHYVSSTQGITWNQTKSLGTPKQYFSTKRSIDFWSLKMQLVDWHVAESVMKTKAMCITPSLVLHHFVFATFTWFNGSSLLNKKSYPQKGIILVHYLDFCWLFCRILLFGRVMSFELLIWEKPCGIHIRLTNFLEDVQAQWNFFFGFK